MRKRLLSLVYSLCGVFLVSGCANLNQSLERSLAEQTHSKKIEILDRKILSEWKKSRKNFFSYSQGKREWSDEFLKVLKEANKLKYISDGTNSFGEKNDYWKTPDETWRDGGGDCEDLTFALQDFAQLYGFKISCLYGLLDLTGTNDSKHIWGEFKEDGQVWVIDLALKNDICFVREKDMKKHIPLYVPSDIRSKLNNYKKQINKPFLRLNEDYPLALTVGEVVKKYSKKDMQNQTSSDNNVQIIKPLRALLKR